MVIAEIQPGDTGQMPLELVAGGRGEHGPQLGVGHSAVAQIHHHITVTVALSIPATVQLELAQRLELRLT